MYNPSHFRETRVPVLHDLIRRHPLATLVTLGPDGLVANHIPMEIDPEPEPFGTLRGHVARANPVWRDFAKDVDALVIFAGPQLYVTPSWYPTKQESGKVVPTWNYAVVHAHGPLRPIDDVAWLRDFVTRLTNRHEGTRAAPWHVADAPADFIERQLGSIVGIEIPVRRFEGKWKVSQNRAAPDRAGVVVGLRETDDPASHAMAYLVANADVTPPRASP
jgi:transcriptional regulator